MRAGGNNATGGILAALELNTCPDPSGLLITLAVMMRPAKVVKRQASTSCLIMSQQWVLGSYTSGISNEHKEQQINIKFTIE
jgi:hypothetical protein